VVGSRVVYNLNKIIVVRGPSVGMNESLRGGEFVGKKSDH